IVEAAMSVRKAPTRSARTRQQPLQPKPIPPIVQPHQVPASTRSPRAADDLRRAARIAEQARRDAEACAKIAAMPIQHEHAAGIDVGDASHWVCVEATPDGSDAVREFPAHTPGLRQLVAWLHCCAVTTVALEASGAYGHVLF